MPPNSEVISDEAPARDATELNAIGFSTSHRSRPPATPVVLSADETWLDGNRGGSAFRETNANNITASVTAGIVKMGMNPGDDPDGSDSSDSDVFSADGAGGDGGGGGAGGGGGGGGGPGKGRASIRKLRVGSSSDDHKSHFESMVQELETLAATLANGEATQRKLHALQQETHARADRNAAGNISYTSLANEAKGLIVEDVPQKVLKLIQERITATRVTHDETMHAIGRVMNEYSVPTDGKNNETALSSIPIKTYDVPKHLMGHADPTVADELLRGLMTLFKGNWRQTWALIPVLYRMTYDFDDKLVRWQPDQLRDVISILQNKISDKRRRAIQRYGGAMFTNCIYLPKYYAQQCRALGGLLLTRDRKSVIATYDLYICPNSDETGTIKVKSMEGDSITSIFWWVTRHYRFGFVNRDKLQDLLHYMANLFHSGSLSKAVTRIRGYLPLARTYKLKLTYHRTIGRCAAAVQGRHNSFTVPMEDWLTPPDFVTNTSDVLGHIDTFLGVVEHLIDVHGDKMQMSDSFNKHAAQGRLAFARIEGEMMGNTEERALLGTAWEERGRNTDRHFKGQGEKLRPGSMRAGSPGVIADLTACQAKGCERTLPEAMYKSVIKAGASPTEVICGDCFRNRLLDHGSCTLKNGKTRLRTEG